MNAASPRTLRIASACFTALFLLPASIHAHPHQFIDVVETIRLDEHGIAGVTQEWCLLGTFGIDTESHYDLDQDGEFDEAEQAGIFDTTFLPLWLYNNFFHLKLLGVEYAARSIQDFRAEIIRGEVRFTFYIPCGIPRSGTPVEVEMITYDSSNFISFDLHDCRVEDGDGTDYPLEFVPDPSVISHGPDRCGTWVRFVVAAAASGGAVAPGAAGKELGDNLMPMTGSGPAAPVNPFAGSP